jgi:hypothetical protein
VSDARTSPTPRRGLRLLALTLGVVVASTACSGRTGEDRDPLSTPSRTATASPDPTLPAWDLPVSRVVVDDGEVDGSALITDVENALRQRHLPVVSPMVLGPEDGGEHPGRLTAWFERELSAAQEDAVRASLTQGASAELTTEPGTDLELVFTPRVQPSSPIAAPWPADREPALSQEIAQALTDGGGIAVYSLPQVGGGRSALAYEGPRLTADAVQRLRDVLASVAVEQADDIVARRGGKDPSPAS